MPNLMMRIHTVETNEVIDRKMTADEAADLSRDAAALKLLESQTLAKATAKAALLARLGITADEAKLLLEQS